MFVIQFILLHITNLGLIHIHYFFLVLPGIVPLGDWLTPSRKPTTVNKLLRTRSFNFISVRFWLADELLYTRVNPIIPKFLYKVQI